MENLRWILIFAGVAILGLLYFSGRPTASTDARQTERGRRSSGEGRSRRARRDTDSGMDMGLHGSDPLMGELDSHGFEPPTGDSRQPREQSSGLRDGAPPSGFDGFEVDPDDMIRPAAPRARAPHDFEAPEPALEYDDPAANQYAGGLPPELRDEPRGAAAPGASAVAASALGGLSQKIEAFGAKLSSRRHERVAASSPDDDEDGESAAAPAYASKIITLHVVARGDARFDGQTLIDCFERRELSFGEMNIFHSMHHDKTVFSVAKMVEPGWFDPHDLDSFTTPGITLILQLPGPVAADTAFEVLLSEAFEIATELGGTVLDGDRSTLSKQTAQHMREGIYEYMHRQKYFGSVAS